MLLPNSTTSAQPALQYTRVNETVGDENRLSDDFFVSLSPGTAWKEFRNCVIGFSFLVVYSCQLTAPTNERSCAKKSGDRFLLSSHDRIRFAVVLFPPFLPQRISFPKGQGYVTVYSSLTFEMTGREMKRNKERDERSVVESGVPGEQVL